MLNRGSIAGHGWGGSEILPSDTAQGEARYSLGPVDELTAEKIYERRWAWTLIDSMMRMLEDESVSGGRGEACEVLRSFTRRCWGLKGHRAQEG
jgi:hypothetical protein